MVVKIHGHAPSVCTCAVTVALKEINVPYEIIPVNMADMKTKEYAEQKHPFGQIPVLIEDDGFKLFKSRAIAHYLIAKHAPDSKLIPKDPKENTLFEQAASIKNNYFYPSAAGLAAEKVFKLFNGAQGSNERAAEHISTESTLKKKLEGYERILGKQKYLAGNELTLADLLHLPYSTLIMERCGFKGFQATPNVARWWNDISSCDSWKEIKLMMLEFFAEKKN